MLNYALVVIIFAMAATEASAETTDAFENWPILKSTFPSTSGAGMMIKGYDPVITGAKCVTTFMAVSPDPVPTVYPAYIEFEAVPAQGGTLCTNGNWRMIDGSNSGTTPYRVFFKDGVFRGSP